MAGKKFGQKIRPPVFDLFLEIRRENSAHPSKQKFRKFFGRPTRKFRKFFGVVTGKIPKVFPVPTRKIPKVFLDGYGENSESFSGAHQKKSESFFGWLGENRQVFSGQIQEHVGKYFWETLKNATSLLWIGPHRVGKYFRHILSRPQASSLITVSMSVVTNVTWCRRIIIKGLLVYCLSIRKFGKSRMRIKHVTNSDYHKPDDSSLFKQYMSNYQ